MNPQEKECLNNQKIIEKIFYFICTIFLFYLFILSISLIKESSSGLWQGISAIIKKDISPINAFGIGWFFTLIMQSSSAAISSLLALNAQGLISSSLIVYTVLGTRIGTSIAFLLAIFIIKSKKTRDFRHAFEIGLASIVYAVPIAIFLFLVEYFFHPFFKLSQIQLTNNLQNGFSFVNAVTSPILNLLKIFPEIIILIFGFLLLILSLNSLPKIIFKLWGQDKIKKIMNKFFKNEKNSFILGLVLTSVMMSTGITITLMIPFIIARIINLKKALPYMIGANLGGVTDAILGGLIIGSTAFPGVLAYVTFSLLGLFWLLNTNLLFNITKYLSKKMIHVSRKRAVYFLLFFIVLAIILCFI